MKDDKPEISELINLIQRIIDDDFGSEEESDQALIDLERSVTDPGVLDLIFHSDEELTAEEIYRKAVKYKQIT